MCFMRLPHPAAAHVMVMVVMMTVAHHWIMIVPISHSHPPEAETAKRIEEIPRAEELESDRKQYRIRIAYAYCFLVVREKPLIL